MKIPPSTYRSPLSRWQSDEFDAEALKREGWREKHILVVSEKDERLDFVEREIVRRLGERLYGGRNG